MFSCYQVPTANVSQVKSQAVIDSAVSGSNTLLRVMCTYVQNLKNREVSGLSVLSVKDFVSGAYSTESAATQKALRIGL